MRGRVLGAGPLGTGWNCAAPNAFRGLWFPVASQGAFGGRSPYRGRHAQTSLCGNRHNGAALNRSHCRDRARNDRDDAHCPINDAWADSARAA